MLRFVKTYRCFILFVLINCGYAFINAIRRLSSSRRYVSNSSVDK